MARQTINLGTAPTGQGGDTPRSANVKIDANFDELYDALGAGGAPKVLPAALPVAKGGTGGTTQATARSGLGLKAAAVADILGTVSQSGGVPTGAIIERGSNANGEYVKFADGTMICSGLKDLGNQSFVSVGSIFYTGAFSPMAFPATFAGIPKVNIGVISSGGLAWASQGSSFATTTTTAGFYVMNPAATANSLTAVYIAIGRWFP